MASKRKKQLTTIGVISSIVLFLAIMFMFIPAYGSDNSFNLMFGVSKGATILNPLYPLMIAFFFALASFVIILGYKWLFYGHWVTLTSGILAIVSAITFFITSPMYDYSVKIGQNHSFPMGMEPGPIVVGVFLAIAGVALVVWYILEKKKIV
jgi:hypothetical protein